jgi:hypothetical protein
MCLKQEWTRFTTVTDAWVDSRDANMCLAPVPASTLPSSPGQEHQRGQQREKTKQKTLNKTQTAFCLSFPRAL